MTCTCDKDKIEDAKKRAVRRIAPYECDAEGNKLFYVDSFGYRGPFPGECQECYDAMCAARKAYFEAENAKYANMDPEDY